MSIVPGMALARQLAVHESWYQTPHETERTAIELGITLGFTLLFEPEETKREQGFRGVYDFLTEFVHGDATETQCDSFDDFLSDHQVNFDYRKLGLNESTGVFIRMRDLIKDVFQDTTLNETLNGQVDERRQEIAQVACREQLDSFHMWIDKLGVGPEGQILKAEGPLLLAASRER